MKTNLTMIEREAVPNKVRCVLQADGLWTVYQTGDELPELPVSPPVIEVTRLQLKLAMVQAGLLGQVEAHIAASGDETLRIYWQESAFFHRHHPLVTGTAAAMGKTEAEIDAVFDLAVTL